MKFHVHRWTQVVPAVIIHVHKIQKANIPENVKNHIIQSSIFSN